MSWNPPAGPNISLQPRGITGGVRALTGAEKFGMMSQTQKSLGDGYFSKGASAANSAANIAGLADSLGASLGFAKNISAAGKKYSDMVFQQPDNLTERGDMPSFAGLASLSGQVQSVDPNEAGKGLVGQGVQTGIQAGSSIGALAGPLGGAIGAGIGGLVGLTAGLFGKKSAKKKAEDALTRGQEAFSEAQDTVNEQVQDYYTGVGAQRQDIQGDRSYQQRMYGLGNFNSPFASII